MYCSLIKHTLTHYDSTFRYQVLYDIVIESNLGKLDFDTAIKRVMGNVNGAGELVAMHILAVLSLTGNCINRDFLRNATLGQACKKQVRDKIFSGQNVTPSQMKSAMKGVVRKMGLSAFMVENLLCEALRPKPGFDTFHPEQSISFLEDDTDNIVCVTGDKVEIRSVEDDLCKLQQLPTFDQIVPEWKWWTAPQGVRGIHDWFVKSCKERDIDPSSLFIRPHTNAKVCQSQQHIWRHYLNKVGKKEGKAKWKADESLKILHPNPEREAKKGRLTTVTNYLSGGLHI
jgi:hypothetical protein